MRHNRALLSVIVIVLASAAGCSAGSPASSSASLGDISTGLEASLARAISDTGAPLRLTQAEFQETDEGLWWITQFDDPAESGAGSGIDSETLVFAAPLKVVRRGVKDWETDLRELQELTTFIIAFRDPQQTVYEIDSALMWSFVEGEVGEEEVVDEMMISSLNH